MSTLQCQSCPVLCSGVPCNRLANGGIIGVAVSPNMSSPPVVAQPQCVRSAVVATNGTDANDINANPMGIDINNIIGTTVDHNTDLNGDPLGQKSPMCRINEICRYNDIKHEYHLIDESGPAHSKTFTGGSHTGGDRGQPKLGLLIMFIVFSCPQVGPIGRVSGKRSVHKEGAAKCGRTGPSRDQTEAPAAPTHATQ